MISIDVLRNRKKKNSGQNLKPVINERDVTVFNEDNLTLLQSMQTGSIDCIYVDPPFFTRKTQVIDSKKGDHNSPTYSDKWESLSGYIEWMRPRVQEMQRVLKNEGIIFFHCDWHASHYLKILLDETFGYKCFKNEIIWQRSVTVGRMNAANYQKLDVITDSIFVYSKTPGTKLKKVYVDHLIPFNGEKPPIGYYFDQIEKKFFKTSPLGNYSSESIKLFKKNNRIYETKNGMQRLKYFVSVKEISGKKFISEKRELGNLWTDVSSMMHSSAENKIKYPTQKPVSLITRLLSLVPKAKCTVADFFHGSGSTMIAALELGALRG